MEISNPQLDAPKQFVKNAAQLADWYRSKAYFEALGFINTISTAIQGKRITDNIYVSEAMSKILKIFDELNVMVNETPIADQPSRFGNVAYRKWAYKMRHNIYVSLQKAIPEDKCHILNELGTYLSEAFGNATRIDYGTGHEFSFIFFLCSLFISKIFTEQDREACALRLFVTYLTFVRRLQITYRLEPAGSQGVWALDDYQFVPFIWGSAQFAISPPFDPVKFLDEDIIQKYKEDYMFIGCIDFICKVKTGHFAEHSNQLWSISAVPSWIKINSGLVKMYKTELLSKFPIIQHVYFGKLMPFDPVPAGTAITPAQLGSAMLQNVTTLLTEMGPPTSIPAQKTKNSSEGSVENSAAPSETIFSASVN